ncbi:hypothetical protein EJB05_22504, partial [Eragrostis curvula]
MAGVERATTVCVTGAGGFVGSWLVKRLLAGGYYTIHGTVRDPGDAKNAHLREMDGAAERLRLFKADLLDYGSMATAVAGCDGAFHVACPVHAGAITNPEAGSSAHRTLSSLGSSIILIGWPDDVLQVEMLAPAVTGTVNVMKACAEAKVKRVVVVSSLSAWAEPH